MNLRKKELFFILGVVLLAIVLRFWNFRGYLTFLDDQGRDALVAKQLLVDHDITLLGPRTSVGNMYLGPLYYYAMVPFLAMTYPDPTGPAYAIAVLGVITVVAVYLIGRKIVGRRAAAIAALLCALTPSAVTLSRFSWQPNPAPFFGLLMLWWTIEAVKGKTWRWFWVGVAFTILVQLHYVALLSAVPAGILFIYDFWSNRKGKGKLRKYMMIAFSALAVFLASQLPLVAFDIRHDGILHEGFAEFFQAQGKSVSPLLRIGQFVVDLHGRGMFLLVELLGFSKEIRLINTVLLAGILAVVVWQLSPKNRKKNPHAVEFGVVALWVGTAWVGLSAYRNTIYPHYFAYLFPAVFLLIGSSLAFLMKRGKELSMAILAGFVVLCVWNVATAPYWTPKTPDIDRIKSIATDMIPFIAKDSAYNITVYNDNREYQAMKYRYFFEVFGPRPKSQYDYTHLDQLVLISEDGTDPLKAPIYEVQQFMLEAKKPQLMTTKIYQDIVRVYLYGKK